MEFTITIRMDNVSMEEAPVAEVTRILWGIIENLADSPNPKNWDFPLFDISGNSVGRAETFTDRNKFRR